MIETKKRKMTKNLIIQTLCQVTVSITTSSHPNPSCFSVLEVLGVPAVSSNVASVTNPGFVLLLPLSVQHHVHHPHGIFFVISDGEMSIPGWRKSHSWMWETVPGHHSLAPDPLVLNWQGVRWQDNGK